MSKKMNKETCELCGKQNTNVIKFYWGFFDSEYNPDKWINICDKCQTRFLKASNVYSLNREPLMEMESDIKCRVRR